LVVWVSIGLRGPSIAKARRGSKTRVRGSKLDLLVGDAARHADRQRPLTPFKESTI